jgi:predicted nucleotidyltransferase
MVGIIEDLHQIARPVITALATVNAVVGVVCFGSYALGTADAASDVNLYVRCEATLIPKTTRRSLFERLPGISELHLQHSTPGWENAWAPQSDQLKIGHMGFDLSYNTQSWVAAIVQRVLTQGALSLAALYAARTVGTGYSAVRSARTGEYPPRETLALSGRVEGKTDPRAFAHNDGRPGGIARLRDATHWAERVSISVGRVCNAIVSILYAANEHYDSATKRPEQELKKLAIVPDQFVARFIQLQEGPFDTQGRQRVVGELAILVDEITQIAHRAVG